MDPDILETVRRASRQTRTIVLAALLVCHLPAAMIYEATVGHELVTYYAYDGIKDGIHYGLIALTLIRLSPAGLLFGATVLSFEILSSNLRNGIALLAFDFAVVAILLAIIGPGLLADLSSISSTTDQLSIDHQVYYAVRKLDGESGAHCYLLACDGVWGRCHVLGSIGEPFPVTMQYREQQRTIILQNAAEEHKEFVITPLGS